MMLEDNRERRTLILRNALDIHSHARDRRRDQRNSDWRREAWSPWHVLLDCHDDAEHKHPADTGAKRHPPGTVIGV